jgi:hypothetical protein
MGSGPDGAVQRCLSVSLELNNQLLDYIGVRLNRDASLRQAQAMEQLKTSDRYSDPCSLVP